VEGYVEEDCSSRIQYDTHVVAIDNIHGEMGCFLSAAMLSFMFRFCDKLRDILLETTDTKCNLAPRLGHRLGRCRWSNKGSAVLLAHAISATTCWKYSPAFGVHLQGFSAVDSAEKFLEPALLTLIVLL
jgi:hypothetical protein